MDTVILKEIPFEINSEHLIKRLHITDEDDMDRVNELVDEARKIGRPKGIYVTAFIDSKGEDSVTIEKITFNSRVMRINLNDLYRVIPYSATCGTELEEWSGSINDVLEQYWADTIKEMALGSAVNFLRTQVKEKFSFEQVSSMNPGSLEDWPLREQEKLFSLLGNTVDTIGVRLTDSLLMIPKKSVSGIFFPTKTGFESCQLCPRNECPGRRAPYDEVLYSKKFGMLHQ